MKTVVKNAPSDTMKAKIAENCAVLTSQGKRILRSHLNYNTKKVSYVNMFFFLKESIVNPNKHLECL